MDQNKDFFNEWMGSILKINKYVLGTFALIIFLVIAGFILAIMHNNNTIANQDQYYQNKYNELSSRNDLLLNRLNQLDPQSANNQNKLFQKFFGDVSIWRQIQFSNKEAFDNYRAWAIGNRCGLIPLSYVFGNASAELHFDDYPYVKTLYFNITDVLLYKTDYYKNNTLNTHLVNASAWCPV